MSYDISSNVSSPEWLHSISLGQIPGHRVFQVQGMNPDVDTISVPEAVIPQGGLYPWAALTTNLAMQAVSTSANDSAAGTGMRTILVQGLNSSLAEIQETVTLNGLTPVALVNSYYRINNMIGLTAGSGTVNAGDVTIQTAVGAVVVAFMPVGYGRDQSCRYTVPAGYQLWPIEGYASILELAGAGLCAFQLLAREAGGPFISRFHFVAAGSSPTVRIIPSILRPLGPGSDIVIRATNVTANNTLVTVTMNMLMTAV